MGTKLSLMNRITDYPLLVLAVAFFALWLSSRIGSSILKKRRKLEEDIRARVAIRTRFDEDRLRVLCLSNGRAKRTFYSDASG